MTQSRLTASCVTVAVPCFFGRDGDWPGPWQPSGILGGGVIVGPGLYLTVECVSRTNGVVGRRVTVTQHDVVGCNVPTVHPALNQGP